ncbi:MAG: universal stress protein [Nitrospiraceae bacterium]|jgi:nucleotide-binding universal stress UspA family protein|nr:universal stress protein [Nitrospiraceae bacterium]
MFKKILVPLDGSELAASILPQVEDLAKSQQAAVVLLTVGNFSSMAAMIEAAPRFVEETMEALKKTALEKMEPIAAAIKAKGIPVEFEYREGMPAQEILICAAEKGCDLIAMATHGRGEVAWVLGSVAEKVVTHATVPVLLMRVIEPQPLETKRELFGGP